MADDHQSRLGERSGLTRRVFLGGIGVTGIGAIATACSSDDPSPAGDPDGGPTIRPEDAVPPDHPRDALQYFNHSQAQTVDAVTARLIPGDDTNPGASEAGVVYYIDHLLANHTGHAQSTYTSGPYAQAYEGDLPAEERGVIWVEAGELERYGWQSADLPRDIYGMGLGRLDVLARARFDGNFVDLTAEQQDGLLAAVEDDEDDDVNESFGDLPAGTFFELIRRHTVEGFFADPVYGGNRNAVGWRLIGFPGSRRSYSPADIFNEGFDVEPQSLLDLPAFNADHNEHHDDVPGAVRTRHPLGPID